jgi:hypothetical protein
VVTSGVRGVPRVDIGAWTALALGPSGGPGNPDLCLPLALRPDAFGLSPATTGVVSVRIAIIAPDEDMSRVYAHTEAQLTTSETTLPVSGVAAALVDSAVATMVEPLRGLGGEASTGVVETVVRCGVSRL